MTRKPTYEELEQRVKELEKEAAKHKKLEEVMRHQAHALGERVKELNCLYGMSNLVEKKDISLEEILQGTIDLIPPSWQYPEITSARIILEGKEFGTENFRETTWKQTSDIRAHGERIGTVEVCYLEEKPESDDGPFLKEERNLINAIAHRLRRIIERKRAEEGLWVSEQRFRQFFENEPEYCYMISPEGVILDLNKSALKVLGYKKEELVGKSLKTIYAPEVLPKTGVLFPKWRKTGKLKDEELVIISKKRDRRTVLLSADAVKDRDGKILHSVSVQKDITDRKRAEEALRESEEKYRSLVESTEDSIYLVDRNRRYLFVNKKHLSRFPLPIGKVIGRAYSDFHSEEETKGFEEKVKEVFETGKSLSYEYRSQRDGGYFLRTLSPVKEPDGETTDVTVVSKNVTERKRAEEAFRQAAALKTLTTVLENFIGDSLGNLLFIVYGQLGLCELSDSIDQVRSNISAATQGLNELIQGTQAYQEFSSLTEGSLGDINSVAFGPILEPFLSGKPLQTYQKKRFPINPKVKLRFAYDPEQEGVLSWEELPPVSGSKRAIATALQETLINAVESYDPGKGGHVMVSAKKEGYKLILEIADKGRGMSNEEREKSQLPFFKILGIKGSARLGLGAYIARQSAEYCGGDIHIESREGIGTTASISFKVSDQVS